MPRSILTSPYLIKYVQFRGMLRGRTQEASGFAEFGWPVGMPVCRSLNEGLHEIRSDIGHGRTARVIFCIDEGRMVLLHAFIKKTRKTPKRDQELAARRRKELRR